MEAPPAWSAKAATVVEASGVRIEDYHDGMPFAEAVIAATATEPGVLDPELRAKLKAIEKRAEQARVAWIGRLALIRCPRCQGSGWVTQGYCAILCPACEGTRRSEDADQAAG